MNPLLLTLYGNELAGSSNMWFTIVCAAVTNVVSDVTGVKSGNESTGQAVLNTLFPYIGGVVGSWIWPTKSKSAAAVQDAADSANHVTGLATAITAGSILLLAGGTAYSFMKKKPD